MELKAKDMKGAGTGRLPEALEPGGRAGALPVWLLFGPDETGISDLARTLCENFDDRIVFDAETLDRQMEAIATNLASQSLFGGRQAVVLKGVSDTQKSRIDKLIDIIETSHSPLILTAGDLKKTGKLRKLFSDDKRLVSAPLYPLREREAIGLAQALFQGEGLRATRWSLEVLGRHLPGDRGGIRNAVETISLHVLGRGGQDVEARDIRAILEEVDESRLHEPLDALLDGDMMRSLRSMNAHFDSGESAIVLIRAMARRAMQYRRMMETSLDPDTAIMKAKPPVFWADKPGVKARLERLSPNRLNAVMQALDEAESMIIEKRAEQRTALSYSLTALRQTLARLS